VIDDDKRETGNTKTTTVVKRGQEKTTGVEGS